MPISLNASYGLATQIITLLQRCNPLASFYYETTGIFAASPYLMPSQKVRSQLSVHGSIPHHERKIRRLRLHSSVRPEVSKGERDFLRGRQNSEHRMQESRGKAIYSHFASLIIFSMYQVIFNYRDHTFSHAACLFILFCTD